MSIEAWADIRREPSPPVSNPHLEHMQAELGRIDVLLARAAQRWSLADQDVRDDYRGIYVTPEEVARLLERPFAVHWGDTVTLEPVVEEVFRRSHEEAARRADTVAQEMMDRGETPRLYQVARAFGLDSLALDILLLTLAPAFDPGYQRIYGFLQDHVARRRPTVRLVLDLFGAMGHSRFALAERFSADAPLCKFGLIEMVIEPPPANEHWINQTLHADDLTVAWLMGLYRPPAHLADHFVLTTPQAPVRYQELVEERIEKLALALELPPNRQPIVTLYGADRIGHLATAEGVAARAQRGLLTVMLDKVVGENCTPQKAIRMALRDARLTGAIPFFTGWEVCLRNNEAADPELLAELSGHPGMLFVASPQRWWAEGSTRKRPIWWEQYTLPTHTQRRTRWEYFLSEYSSDMRLAVQEEELTLLAGQFVLSSDQIRDAVATTAGDSALQESETVGTGELKVADLYRSARQHSSLKLSALARKITPHFGWGDLILPSEPQAILHEMLGAIRERPTVLEEWGVARKLAPSRGITALFTGSPGTGKTMAAEVIAGELGLDLYKIDLASVVSKYIGETEKNLERIFTEAATSNAILFFDEADAIFGKRSEVKDAHDRYANIEISYLLQRMEAYDGVTILATNLRANLDEAFARRLQFSVDFPFPQAVDRLRIWETLFPVDVPRVEGLNLGLLSRRFELAGGNIRNIIINAAYLAASDGGKVTMAHLLHSTRRELQKIGRLFGDEEFIV